MFLHNLDGNYTQVPEGSVSKQQILKSLIIICTYVRQLDDVQRTKGKPQNRQWKCSNHIKKPCTGISGKTRNLYLKVNSK